MTDKCNCEPEQCEVWRVGPARCQRDSQKCPSCNGRGTDEWGATCLQCGGKGRLAEDGGYLDHEEIREQIEGLIPKAETGEQWAEICRLEALAVELERARS